MHVWITQEGGIPPLSWEVQLPIQRTATYHCDLGCHGLCYVPSFEGQCSLLLWSKKFPFLTFTSSPMQAEKPDHLSHLELLHSIQRHTTCEKWGVLSFFSRRVKTSRRWMKVHVQPKRRQTLSPRCHSGTLQAQSEVNCSNIFQRLWKPTVHHMSFKSGQILRLLLTISGKRLRGTNIQADRDVEQLERSGLQDGAEHFTKLGHGFVWSETYTWLRDPGHTPGFTPEKWKPLIPHNLELKMCTATKSQKRETTQSPPASKDTNCIVSTRRDIIQQ